ncbi:sugar transferase [Robertkochia marina]|uniref:Sugar transferase n=1 Tax=Robertkochia marina TaxID=1227945 RepID=A0A4V3UY28_9FLAO|nr:sugar transferase [Robertkochia marina]THD66794.1 sugar transferase [Robertkochia marina]TRZ41915.1 sugar transferase [Robertkochia marina]
MYVNFIKRILDFTLALTFFLLLTPVFLGLYFYLALTTEEPVFFKQLRPGKNGELFYIKKFRTMNEKRDLKNELLSDEERLTRVGKILRKYSLDEIPQLLNVINGDMSLVGPRPLLPEYLPLYTKYQNKRHEVRPGITGWAQVNGRNAITWETRLDLDVWYVQHISFFLDIRILFMTLLKVFNNNDVASPTHATMEKFTGSKM